MRGAIVSHELRRLFRSGAFRSLLLLLWLAASLGLALRATRRLSVEAGG